jgi:acyl carrier protein
MGLDLVILEMEIEKQFGVNLPGPGGQRIHTVGDLYEYLLDQRTRSLAGVCPSAAAFYHARRALCMLFGTTRRDVCPSSAVEELIPVKDRRWHWRRFCAALRPFILPDLRRPGWLRRTFGYGCAALVLVAAVSGLVGYHRGQPPVLAGSFFLAGVLFGAIAYAATIPLAVSVPAECGTMRGLVHAALGGERDKALTALKHRSDREVWDQMCEIISVNLGIDRDFLTPDTDFVKDLGAA